MTDMKTLALQVAVLKDLTDRLAEVTARAREELLAQMEAAGAEKVTAELPGNVKVASVSRAGGHKVTAVVVDEAELLAWVKETRPDEVEERVRPAYRRVLLDELGRKGEEAPGVELTLSSAYVSNRFAAGGKDAIARAWASGSLGLSEVLALPPAAEPVDGAS